MTEVHISNFEIEQVLNAHPAVAESAVVGCSRQHVRIVQSGWSPRTSRTRISWARESIAGAIRPGVRSWSAQPVSAAPGSAHLA